MESTDFDFEELDPEMLSASELLELELGQLDELFSGAETPEPGELSGPCGVLWLAGPAADFLPGPLKKLKAMIAGSPIFPWKGMEFETSFDDESIVGSNLLFSMESGVKLFDFEVRVDDSEYDGMECLVFDYDTEGNFLLFKKLRDEVRKVNSSLYLGRGNIVIGGEARFIAYFSIEPE